jgi:DNA-binding MarR family transcriptional regulator
MLKSLEQLGFVTRSVHVGDRRKRLVLFTKLGLERIRMAIRWLVRAGAAELAVGTALATTEWHDDDACFVATEHFESFVRGIRRCFGDRAKLHYPWHPDD